MKSNKVACIGVLYPSMKVFSKYYFESLESQSFKDFDLILNDDGYILDNGIIPKASNNIIVTKFKGTPTTIRLKLFQYVVSMNYEYIIFTDTDDTIAPNRVEISYNYLNTHDHFINELNIIDENNLLIEKNYLSNRITNNSQIIIDNIFHYNFIGLSNTAVRKDILKKIIERLSNANIKNIKALDWLMWSIALLEGANSIFSNKTTTNYRSHSHNIAGFPREITKDKVLYNLQIKLNHYKLLSNLNSYYNVLYNKFIIIENLSNDKTWLDKYISQLSKIKNEKSFWWEDCKIIEELL